MTSRSLVSLRTDIFDTSQKKSLKNFFSAFLKANHCRSFAEWVINSDTKVFFFFRRFHFIFDCCCCCFKMQKVISLFLTFLFVWALRLNVEHILSTFLSSSSSCHWNHCSLRECTRSCWFSLIVRLLIQAARHNKKILYKIWVYTATVRRIL